MSRLDEPEQPTAAGRRQRTTGGFRLLAALTALVLGVGGVLWLVNGRALGLSIVALGAAIVLAVVAAGALRPSGDDLSGGASEQEASGDRAEVPRPRPALAEPANAEQAAAVAPPVVVAPRRTKPSRDWFVGRDREQKDALDLVLTTESGVVMDIVGVRGVGKSLLLARLVKQATDVPGVVTRVLNMADPPGLQDASDDPSSAADLQRAFQQSVLIMEDLAKRGGSAFHAFQAAKGAAEIKVADAGNHGAPAVTDSALAGRYEITPQPADQVRRDIVRAQSEVDVAFVTAWTEFTSNRRVLVTVDSFERSAGNRLGLWLMEMALRLPRTVVAFARIPADHQVVIHNERRKHYPLADFTLDEVREYLFHKLAGAPLDDEVIELVHTHTGGHPGGVYLMGEFIRAKGPDTLRVSDLRTTLARFMNQRDDLWANLVHEILTEIEWRPAQRRQRSAAMAPAGDGAIAEGTIPLPAIKASVEAAAVLRSMTGAMLGKLLAAADVLPPYADEGPDPETDPDAFDHSPRTQFAESIIEVLSDAGLLRNEPDDDSEPTAYWKMPEFVRVSVAHKMRTEGPRRWDVMHRAAADHFYQALQRTEEGEGEGGYQIWYRYERPIWQQHKLDWLRHSGQVTDRRWLTRARFTVVFLDAFWWWGYYHPFDYNRRLIDDWDVAAATWRPLLADPAAGNEERANDGRLGQALRFIMDEYPKGHQKTGGPWAELGDRLRLVARLCGLVDNPARLTEAEAAELRRARALIDLFLAHTFRYVDPDDEQARRHYHRARDGFEQDGDPWTVSWLDMEMADMALERGQLEEVAPLLAGAAELALAYLPEDDDRPDYELIADLYRVRADTRWARGDTAAAAHAYGVALASAYWFQGQHLPDTYTQRFYAEMTERAADRVLEQARRTGEGDAMAVAAAMRVGLAAAAPSTVDDQTLLTAIRDGRREDVEAVLFRPGPVKADLKQPDGVFMTAWDRVAERRFDAEDVLTDLLPVTSVSTVDGD